MSHVEEIADLVERVMEGDPWHGSSVVTLLDGVPARAAAAHAVPGAHSIWELVLHMTGWAREVRARLEGEPAGEPAGGDWPPVRDTSATAWAAAVAALVESHRALAAAVRAGDERVLTAPVVDRRDPAAGTGLSRVLTLHGLVHHTAYHAGQIALVKRAIEARVS
ncbi:MAG: DinB family protein [Acidobacteria bacterium]|nr:DinB family protein [Acidobacteriota bacterium]